MKLSIDGRSIEAQEGATVLQAAREAGIYIPALCSHPDLPPLEGVKPQDHVFRGAERVAGEAPPEAPKGCQLCLVEVAGRGLVTACTTAVGEGMVVRTDTAQVKEQRARNLVPILARHPHACLTCAQQEGCVREPCSSSVPVAERCCARFGRCELQKVANFIGVRPETPKYVPRGLAVLKDEPLFIRDFNLCINCARCVRACTDVRDVGGLGFVYKNGERVVGGKAPSPREWDCRFCGACVEVCPTGALLDKEAFSESEREAVLVPCRSTCPAGVDIPSYVRLVAQGREAEALEVIRERAPLPFTLGYICLRPCEARCRRGQLDEAVSIREVKKHAARRDARRWKGKVRVPAPSGKKVAVVGSGPAGLTAAYLLSLKGHDVTILESGPRPGGVLDWGIPSFRLPRKALNEDLSELLALARLRTGVEVGKDIPLDELIAGHDAVLLATGLPRSKRLALEGSGLEGVLWGVEFLHDFNAGKRPRLGPRTLVVGGGNVAVDVARAALRSGASKVVMVCLEPKGTMPAARSEVEEAEGEGIEVRDRWGPARLEGKDGRVAALELVRCTRVFDDGGRFNPSFDETCRERIEADTVIFAIGQDADLAFLSPESGVKAERNAIAVDRDGVTSRRGVFAAGDVARQPGAVVDAVAGGRRAASAIDRFLGGDGNVDLPLWERRPPVQAIGKVEGFASMKRKRGRKRGVADSEPAELDLGEAEAREEALRCLQCDLRLSLCKNPAPPEKYHPFNAETLSGVPSTEGVFILLDEKKQTLKIAGVQDLSKALREELARGKARYFHYEEDRMYTKKESELLQQYIQQHGRMPGGGEEEDELF